MEEQLLLRGLDLDAAAGEQVEGVGGESAALLDGKAEAVFGWCSGRHGSGKNKLRVERRKLRDVA